MTDEMKKIVDDLIEEYEKKVIGRPMTECEKDIFKDAFHSGILFTENLGTYL